MTKTEHLQLNRWVASDPVSLDEMNENFSILDARGSQTISCADAANISLAGLLLQATHDGRDVSFAERVGLYDLTRMSEITQYENVYVPSDGARILSADYTGESKKILPPIQIAVAKNPVLFYTFRPQNYATLAQLKVNFSATRNASDSVSVRCGGQTVAQSQTISVSNAKEATFSISLPLDPNKTYEFYYSTSTNYLGEITEVTLTAAANTPTAGSVTLLPTPIPQDAARAVIDLYAAGTAPSVTFRLGGGAFSSPLTPAASVPAKSPTGAACTRYRYEAALSAGAGELTLRLGFGAYSTIAYGMSCALL